MGERSDGERLALEAGEGVDVPGRGESGRTLIATSPFQLRVPRAVHLSHSARAERREDLVGAETRTGCQGHLGRKL